ncbi:MAG: type II toxin-antitoxin system VapC family toxin [Pirellulaceae bacterium]
MAYLVDTNILVRLANAADAQHPVASQAVFELHREGEALHLTPQVLMEFRGTATRPLAMNGLGLSTADAQAKASEFEAMFPLLEENADIYPAWKGIVDGLGIIGKQVHDARLVAVCHAHAVTHLLTFNVTHFVRMSGFGPGIAVVDPARI